MEPLIIPKRKKESKSAAEAHSPVNWQFSPLINYQPQFDHSGRRTSSSKDSEHTFVTDCTGSLSDDRRNSNASQNFKSEIDPYFMRHPSLVSHKSSVLTHSKSLQSGIEPVFVRHPSLSSQKSSMKYSSSLQSSHSSNTSSNKDHDVRPSTSGDDTATIQSVGFRCRYCLSQDTPDGDKLISPCLCSGTSQYVHKTCLEKWLTLRNLDECEVCRTKYITQWQDREMCALNFPTMERRDVMMLLLTISFYITLIFQLLGIIYISSTTQTLHTDIKIITLIGLSLGLFWFMIGSIILTIVLYTSEYWKKWRYANKRKVVILDNDVSSASESCVQQMPSDAKFMSISGPRDVRANISNEFDLSLAVPV